MNSRLKKLLIAAGAGFGVIAVVVGVAFATLDPKKIIGEKKDALLQDLSLKLGRELKSGDVTARVGTSLGATISGVRLAGPTGDDGQVGKPQLEIQQVDVQLSLLRALITFGKDLHVERFTVDGLVVRAARDDAGVWNFQDILDKLAADDAKAGKDEKPDAPTDTSALAGLRVANVSVRNGRVELDDAVLGRPLAVSALNVNVSDVVLGEALTVALTASLEDAGKKSPVELSVKLAQLPKDLNFDPLPDVDVKAVLTDVDLAPWGGLVPADVPAPVQGTLRANVTAKLSKNIDVVDVNGTVMARGLVLRDSIGALAGKAERLAAPRGSALDLDVDVGLHLDPEQTRLEKLKITGSGVNVDGTLTMQGSGLAGLKTAAVKAKVDDLAKLLGALPPSLRGLPPEVKIDGPLDATLQKTGDALTGNLGLDGARVRYLSKDEKTGVEEAVFDKAAGKLLNLKLNGKTGSDALTIDDFALVVDTFKLGGKVSLPQKDGEPLTADIHSGVIPLASLQGLLPPFKDAIGRGQKVEGNVSIDVTAKSVGGKQEALIEAALKNLDVNLASTVVKGSGTIEVKAAPGGGDVAIVAKADLDGLSIVKTSDGETTLNKSAGTPLRLDADVKKGESQATINSVKLLIGKSAINGKGSVTNIGKKGEALNLDFGSVDLAFNDLRGALPGASKLPAGGRLKGSLALKGGLSAAALGLDANNLDISFGSSAIKGRVSVDNFDKLILDVDLTQLVLGFDDLRPLGEATGDLPKGGRFDGSLKLKGDMSKKSTVVVDVKINKLVAGRSDLKGAIKITDLDKPKFALGTQSDFLDVDGLRAAFGGGGDDTPAKPSKDDNPHGLSRSTREMLSGVSGKATLMAKTALVKDMTMTNFTGVLVMTRGVAKFEKLDFGFYGGTVSATGTSLDLPSERTKYDLDFTAKNVDFGAFLADQTPVGKLFKGTLSPKVKVKGRGIAPGDFAISADGPAELSFKQLSIATLDVLGPIGDAMKKTGKATGFNAAAASNEKGLTLTNFTALTRFIGGKLKFEKPVDADTPFGKMKIEGGTGLDSKLDFKSTLNLSPATIKKMTGGKLTVKSDIPVPMKIGGTWDKPVITGVEIDKLLTAIGGAVVGDVLDKVTGGKDAKDVGKDVGKDVVKGVTDLLGGGKKKKKKK